MTKKDMKKIILNRKKTRTNLKKCQHLKSNYNDYLETDDFVCNISCNENNPIKAMKL